MSMQRVAIVGLGVIGGSIGLGLRQAGVHVCGYDISHDQLGRALQCGAIAQGCDSQGEAIAGADVVIVATPVGTIAHIVIDVLDAGAPVVTDVGSVKAPIIASVAQTRPQLAMRFVGGHPMAGSEQDGLDGARADLFKGAKWAVTPMDRADHSALSTVCRLVTQLGAETVVMDAASHDAAVAVVSHVPQLAATALMDVADSSAHLQPMVLQLIAGGFRDMTRIAASPPGIWPDICTANRDVILAAMDAYVDALHTMRALVAQGDGTGLYDLMKRVSEARKSLRP